MVVRKLWNRFYGRFISLRGDPKSIAFGFSIGVLIGFFPIFGVHTAIAILTASVFRMHMAAVFLGSWASGNPLTVGPMLAGEYYLGNAILQYSDLSFPEGEITLQVALRLGWELFSCLLLGGVIIGAVFAVASYPAVLRSMARMQARPEEPPHE